LACTMPQSRRDTAEYLAFSEQEPLRELIAEFEKLLESTTILPKMPLKPSCTIVG